MQQKLGTTRRTQSLEVIISLGQKVDHSNKLWGKNQIKLNAIIIRFENIMWDFNAITSRGERSGPSCDIQISKHFNAFINRLNLVEHELINRKYTQSNGW